MSTPRERGGKQEAKKFATFVYAPYSTYNTHCLPYTIRGCCKSATSEPAKGWRELFLLTVVGRTWEMEGWRCWVLMGALYIQYGRACERACGQLQPWLEGFPRIRGYDMRCMIRDDLVRCGGLRRQFNMGIEPHHTHRCEKPGICKCVNAHIHIFANRYIHPYILKSVQFIIYTVRMYIHPYIHTYTHTIRPSAHMHTHVHPSASASARGNNAPGVCTHAVCYAAPSFTSRCLISPCTVPCQAAGGATWV